MNQEKYIGMDVHQATISVAVMDSSGKLIMECILETKAATILEFIDGLRGTLSVTFEEGTSAAWLHDLLKPYVSHLVVCDPRRNALLKDGSKSDRIDARKLAELLQLNRLHPVYHGEHGVRTLKELGRSYLTISQDLTRVMNRIKALYRSWAIPCSGTTVYAVRHRAEWLAKIPEPGVRRRAGTVVSATGSAAAGASRSATRPDGREPQAPCREITETDSFDRSDSCRLAGGVAANPTPFPYQAPAVGLQWFRSRDARQRRVPLGEWETTTKPGAHHRARFESQP